MNFFDADGLAGKDRAEIDFFLAQTDAATTGYHDGFVVEWIVDVLRANKSCVGLKSKVTVMVSGFRRALD